jgi:hypothetical protein
MNKYNTITPHIGRRRRMAWAIHWVMNMRGWAKENGMITSKHE